MITTIIEWKKINEDGDAPQIIDNLKDLKKFMRKVSADRDGSKTGIRGFWGDF